MRRGQSKPVRDYIRIRDDVGKNAQRRKNWGEEGWNEEDSKEVDAALKPATFKGHAPDFVQKFLDDAVDYGSLSATVVRKRLNEVKEKADNTYRDSKWPYSPELFKKVVQRYIGWTLMTREAVSLIKSQKLSGPIHDVLAGTGYVAESLRRQGLKVFATDKDISPKGEWGLKIAYGKVGRKNAAALAYRFAKIGTPVNVVMSWPPQGLPTIAMDLPKGSMLFLMMDSQYLHNTHNAYLKENYHYIGQARLVDTGADANWWGDKGRDNTLTVYTKVAETSMVESVIFDILRGASAEAVLSYLFD